MKRDNSTTPSLEEFIAGKSPASIRLLNHFIREFTRIGKIQAIPAKTMIGMATSRKRVAYVTQMGRNHIRVVFPFDRPYQDNLCFEKIAQVPGESQYNHHLRIEREEDVNEEVRRFMGLAYASGS